MLLAPAFYDRGTGAAICVCDSSILAASMPGRNSKSSANAIVRPAARAVSLLVWLRGMAPSSKKLSFTPTRSTPRTSFQMPARVCSVAERGGS